MTEEKAESSPTPEPDQEDSFYMKRLAAGDKTIWWREKKPLSLDLHIMDAKLKWQRENRRIQSAQDLQGGWEVSPFRAPSSLHKYGSMPTGVDRLCGNLYYTPNIDTSSKVTPGNFPQTLRQEMLKFWTSSVHRQEQEMTDLENYKRLHESALADSEQRLADIRVNWDETVNENVALAVRNSAIVKKIRKSIRPKLAAARALMTPKGSATSDSDSESHSSHTVRTAIHPSSGPVTPQSYSNSPLSSPPAGRKRVSLPPDTPKYQRTNSPSRLSAHLQIRPISPAEEDSRSVSPALSGAGYSYPQDEPQASEEDTSITSLNAADSSNELRSRLSMDHREMEHAEQVLQAAPGDAKIEGTVNTMILSQAVAVHVTTQRPQFLPTQSFRLRSSIQSKTAQMITVDLSAQPEPPPGGDVLLVPVKLEDNQNNEDVLKLYHRLHCLDKGPDIVAGMSAKEAAEAVTTLLEKGKKCNIMEEKALQLIQPRLNRIKSRRERSRRALMDDEDEELRDHSTIRFDTSDHTIENDACDNDGASRNASIMPDCRPLSTCYSMYRPTHRRASHLSGILVNSTTLSFSGQAGGTGKRAKSTTMKTKSLHYSQPLTGGDAGGVEEGEGLSNTTGVTGRLDCTTNDPSVLYSTSAAPSDAYHSTLTFRHHSPPRRESSWGVALGPHKPSASFVGSIAMHMQGVMPADESLTGGKTLEDWLTNLVPAEQYSTSYPSVLSDGSHAAYQYGKTHRKHEHPDQLRLSNLEDSEKIHGYMRDMHSASWFLRKASKSLCPVTAKHLAGHY